MRQAPFRLNAHLLVRTSGDTAAAEAALVRAVRSFDPYLPVENVASLEARWENQLDQPLLTTALLAIFAGVALVVTLTGIGGLMAMHVSHRMKEFGIRMALGATRAQVLMPVMKSGLLLVSVGLIVGLGAATLLTRVLSPYLFDTTPTDPVAFGGVALALLVTGALACVAPAWRATRVDPQVVFRTD